MLERLMTDLRKPVVAVLSMLLGLTILLWFIRGPQPDVSNVLFFAVSLILVPLSAFAVYGILYLTSRVSAVSDRALRGACVVLWAAGAGCVAISAVSAVYDFATHRSLPSPSLLGFGVALGAMKAWGLRSTMTQPGSR